ncbi:MAG: superoxide dismutase family protein [Betaproteobacteria bacterium]|nr:superoxide dismutase family protein [Betaproteobacteria bacterium]
MPARRTLIVALASGLAACQSPGKPPAEPEAGKRAPSPGVEARLAPSNGSAGQGTAKFVVRGDSLVALVSVAGLIMGSYRVSIHETGNCTSPNAFSAGRPWAPPGSPRAAVDLFPEMRVSEPGHGLLTTTVRSMLLTGPDGLEGKSVIVSAGTTVDADAVPGVPNRRVLCGVIGPPRSLLDVFN